MKKFALLLCALCVITGSAHAAATNDTKTLPVKKDFPKKEQMEKARKAHEAEFEQKLGLTEEQKVQAKELRKKGFEKMKPVMDEIKAKRQEARTVKQADITTETREEKLNALDKDIQELQKKAAEIRKQNMKDFESILTKDQKTTLKNMKKEGRAKFERERRLNPHPCPPPRFEK